MWQVAGRGGQSALSLSPRYSPHAVEPGYLPSSLRDKTQIFIFPSAIDT